MKQQAPEWNWGAQGWLRFASRLERSHMVLAVSRPNGIPASGFPGQSDWLEIPGG